jgi:hypothetical protein
MSARLHNSISVYPSVDNAQKNLITQDAIFLSKQWYNNVIQWEFIKDAMYRQQN